jgi:hypothetical protein
MKVASDDHGTIHFAVTDGHPGAFNTSIYYFAYRHGAFYRADGSLIKTIDRLPLTPADVDKVYDERATHIRRGSGMSPRAPPERPSSPSPRSRRRTITGISTLAGPARGGLTRR